MLKGTEIMRNNNFWSCILWLLGSSVPPWPPVPHFLWNSGFSSTHRKSKTGKSQIHPVNYKHSSRRTSYPKKYLFLAVSPFHSAYNKASALGKDPLITAPLHDSLFNNPRQGKEWAFTKLAKRTGKPQHLLSQTCNMLQVTLSCGNFL